MASYYRLQWLLLLALLFQSAKSDTCKDNSCASDTAGLLQAKVTVNTEGHEESARKGVAKLRSGVDRFMYINLDHSVERRERMAAHFASLGLDAERLPAVALDANTEGSFTDRDKELLHQAFGDWTCRLAAHTCAKGDVVCCLGLADALEMTLHKNSAGATYRKVRGTLALGNLVSHIIALKQIQEDYQKLHKTAPVVLLEDDVRLRSDWDEMVAEATTLAGDFDVIKMFSVVGADASKEDMAACESHCTSAADSQCVLRAARKPCLFWSTGALLVNPSKVGKILKAFETTSHDRAALDAHETRIKRFSIDHLLNEPADLKELNLFAMRPSAAFVDAKLDNSSTFKFL